MEFLLNHIATELEGEPKLIRSIIKSVGEGVATPDGLNPRIKSTIDRERISRKPRWTDNEIVAERVGLISRMNELGLIEREKDGVKVTYVLSPRGRSYLGKLTEKEA